MIKKIYYLLLSLMTTIVYSQKVLFEDNFDTNANGWALSNDGYNVTVDKGKMFIENTHLQNSKWSLYDVSFDAGTTDFDVEATIQLESSVADNAYYGIVLCGYSDNSDYRVFQLSANRYFQIYHYYNKEFHYLKEWEKNDIVKGKGNKNLLRIEKRAHLTKFFINGTMVFQTSENLYYGSKFGFILDKQTSISVDNLKITQVPFSIDVVESFNPNIKMTKMPESISSKEFEEANPVISPDGKTLFCARKDCSLNLDSTKDDVWFSSKDANGNWSEMKNLGRPINNNDYNFVISCSPDNNTLLIGNTYNSDGSVKGPGLSIASRSISGWNVPQEVVMEDYQNKNKFVAYFLTNDNKHLLISVERDGGYGFKDLYICELKPDNTWSKPKNLGNVINTFEEETNPFLASDGKTLYFSSKGHPGYGAFDLFVSKRLDDSWTNWSKPQNLGNVINSVDYELSIFLSAKGDKAYIGKSSDIYEVDNSVKIDPVVLIKGKVYDNKTKKTLSVPIVYNNLKNNTNSGKAISNPVDGSYSIVLPFGQKYSFMAEKEGYYAVTENIDITNLNEYKEIEVDLYLSPIEKGEVIRLNNIFFDSGKYDLLSESYAELDKLHAILLNNPSMKIEISGHTDAVGSDTDNMSLSNNRANAVMQYLLKKGVNGNRLSSKGYGETKFIATNDTEKGKQKNRRVEFLILDL
ncbi:OmpA family protein [Flavobacterium urocaniciphilum]|uniref:WD40-like Beta Propeller Repeat n=1 Tax=Flavobacterium urocaniciphilum TaxID=1299341 RepID=A0A1H9ATZ3_9FLAO|nr:OmpA family protein [Flavobacterium urocaniciphilum]SEP79981.1 WD40-like Beta Propeller Repeat [Flavobacterium urocaniciphilum]